MAVGTIRADPAVVISNISVELAVGSRHPGRQTVRSVVNDVVDYFDIRSKYVDPCWLWDVSRKGTSDCGDSAIDGVTNLKIPKNYPRSEDMNSTVDDNPLFAIRT